jgi:drug/metabolite transporter (DMT)-like permease
MSKQSKGYLFAALGAVLISIFPFILQELTKSTNSPLIATTMFIFSAWALSAPFAIRKLCNKKTVSLLKTKYVLFYLALMVLSSSASNILVAWSLQEIDPATSQFLQRIEVIAMMVIGVVFLAENFSFKLLVSIAGAMCGVLLIYNSPWQYKNWYSLLLPIGSGIGFAILNMCFKKLENHCAPNILNSLRLTFTTLFLILLSSFTISIFNMSAYSWLLAILIAIIGPISARNLYTHSFKYIPVSHSILFTLIAPIGVLCIQGILFDSWPNQHETFGSLIIFVSILYLVVSNIKKNDRQKSHNK